MNEQNQIPLIESNQAISPDGEFLKTRKDLQLTRRLFHFANGSIVASLYYLFLTHSQMIHLLGTIACLIYIIEQVRVNYPEVSAKFIPFTKFIMRAEEQLKESAMVPYMMAVLLTIITFPKTVAICGIMILAISDPLSAIIGIKYGTVKITNHKTTAGSKAFFISSFLIIHYFLIKLVGSYQFSITVTSLLTAFFISLLELLPLKLDDNLTIPIGTSFILWALCSLFSIPV